MKPVVAIALVLFLSACKPAEPPQREAAKSPPPDASTHEAEIVKWRENRITRLKAEDGWLSLVGLHWLREGENTPIPGVAINLKDGKATLRPSAPMTIDGKPVTAPVQLNDDSAENGPAIVQMGTKRFNVIKRGPRFALRVKDSQAETRTQFAGIESYPIDPKWRVEARLEPYSPPKKIPILDVTGMMSDSTSPGALVFTIDGKEHRLDPILEEEGGDYFIIFKDETSRSETYPAGRYLYAKPADANGKVIVDFNKAYNPPCAFTPFATCPLPPAQNRLPVRVEAGEKNYAGGHA
ncbi:MAG TPA: DUF1684 domain-containing protein [Thermoanaerobaculia bacterium]|nr:DUF1684 domain-containing protein [Thermoanaerobaculia bacterium]